MTTTRRLIIGVFLVAVLLVLNGCVVTRSPDYYSGPHLHSTYAHWYYYPDYQVYYHTTDHYYYYYDQGAWIRAHTLPWNIAIYDKRHVRIKLTGLPYLKHSHHIRQYPPKRANHRDRRDRDSRRNYRENRDDDIDDQRRYRPKGSKKDGKRIPNTGNRYEEDSRANDRSDKIRKRSFGKKENHKTKIIKDSDVMEESDSREFARENKKYKKAKPHEKRPKRVENKKSKTRSEKEYRKKRDHSKVEEDAKDGDRSESRSEERDKSRDNGRKHRENSSKYFKF